MKKELVNIRQLEMERAGSIICGGLSWQQVETQALQKIRARKIGKKYLFYT